MELVDGVPITRYCLEQGLSVRQRLDLFLPVCQAIQHAHQKGVIHRDIKPSNVLVGRCDGQAIPKVIDFGIAKAIGQQLTEKTLVTELGLVMGTLEYMSPEQAELTQLDIDTRSDIYSLGVLLYQLLTGSTPLSRETAQRVALDEMLRCIREQEPPKPSTRLSELASGESGAGRAQPEAEQTARMLRGDLDWIVMKALEKDRNRRYETASSLAMDLQRHLRDEPVLARPPTTGYRLKKFARKHRVGVAAAAGFVLLLGMATIVSTALALWANREKGKAVQAQKKEATERARAVGAETAAKEIARKAKESEDETKAVLKFFEEKVLAAARPKGEEGGLGWDATIRTALDSAEPFIEKVLSQRPKIEARIRRSLGRTYFHASDYPKAVRQHERALDLLTRDRGPADEAVVESRNFLAAAYSGADRNEDALRLLKQNLELCRQHFGTNALLTIIALNNLAVTYHNLGAIDQAMPLYEEVLRLYQGSTNAEPVASLTAMNNVAAGYQFTGRATQAVVRFEEALQFAKAKFPPKHPEIISSMNNLGAAYQANAQYEKAMAVQEEAVALAREVLSSNHQHTFLLINNLAVTYGLAGHQEKAIPLLEEALPLARKNLGAHHADTLLTSDNLVKSYQASAQPEKAIPLLEDRLELLQTRPESKTAELLATINQLALSCLAAGRTNEALTAAERMAALAGTQGAKGTPAEILGVINAVAIQLRAGQFVDAEARLRRALEERGESAPYPKGVRGQLQAQLGESLVRQAKFSDAEPLLHQCLEAFQSEQPGLSPVFNAEVLLGWAMMGQKKFTEGEPLLLDAFAGFQRRDRARPSQSHARGRQDAARLLAELYEAQGRTGEAAQWRERMEAKEGSRP